MTNMCNLPQYTQNKVLSRKYQARFISKFPDQCANDEDTFNSQ